ncbi:hypothetical protein AGABI1DRAFT_96156 [Agaricus bisporus var. burnettii JB137-S8]|uniref:Uncharacterized protein n=1 Tax=Agaricus bisporus var. burnettii (strain JB137-S8 / ATCC MYA-4627 / FGSC 10392) TaxID=597362 RepID=K5XH03_AGABU|nr:uncharacterized protein AGABI1DRAFT_96156 [Agaricus bisporus var. burnettii JB137-S8]EKM73670.1 hypothetical protein AGABI1DRAFT_96156 [Agaricus bisporus var. burnettii JB137-S8]
MPPWQQRAPSPPPRNATPGPSNQPPRQERPTWRKRRDITPPDESEHNVRRSRWETKVPNRPDNVYGDKHPSKVLRDYERQPFLPDFEEGIQRRLTKHVAKKFADTSNKPVNGLRNTSENMALNFLPNLAMLRSLEKPIWTKFKF